MQEIVIVGGGTAGWMTAIALAARFPEKRFTVIDAESIGAIGVGESVTGVILQFVRDPLHQLSLGEFFRRCDVTFKAGVWYQDWQGPGTEYLSPIDAPTELLKYYYATNGEEFYAQIIAGGAKLSDVHLYGFLMRRDCTDHFRKLDGMVNDQYAQVSCHFDALKFSHWLREIAKNRPNIRHCNAVVEGYKQDAESGWITSVRTQTGEEIVGDFFLDCSGFHRLLLAKAFSPQWISYRDYLRVDTAIPCFQSYAAGQTLPTYTQAQAMPHGWLWRIPTQSRMGRGYLFASRYIDDAQAISEMRARGVDPGNDPRILRFNPGRYAAQWAGNVCAVGLSGGFMEPLESATIHGMYLQIMLLAEMVFPYLTPAAVPVLAQQYNHMTEAAYEDYLDFISLHYLTGRNDTDFWREYQLPSAITSRNQFRLEKWKHAFPTREDFAPIYTQRAGHTTGLAVWAPMLCGLGLLKPEHAQRSVAMSRHPHEMRENYSRYLQFRDRILSTALSHSEAIAYSRALP